MNGVIKGIMLIALLLFSGCAGIKSMDSAGRVGFTIDEKPDGLTKIVYDSGKEFTGLDIDIQKTKTGFKIRFKADKVGAFKGQEIAAQAMQSQAEAIKALAEFGKSLAP